MLGVPHFSLWVLVLLFPVPHHCSFRSLDYSFSSLSYTRALAVPTHVASRHRLRQYQTEQKRLWHLGIGLDCFKQNKKKRLHHPGIGLDNIKQHITRLRHLGICLDNIKQNKNARGIRA